MKKNFRIILGILLLGAITVYSQEEESAELYLEEYTDEFQEIFFEAIKQKGIENYDKAINLFLECKGMEPENRVIDHELAKVYLAEKQYISALEYGIAALASEPENYWYMNTVVDVLRAQGKSVADIKERIAYDNTTLKENLALILHRNGNYQDALGVLKDLKDSPISEGLTSKIRDSLEQADDIDSKKSTVQSSESDPVMDYRNRLEALADQENYKKLEVVAAEALELFPLQPYFYYMSGKALSRNGKHTEATRTLETALDYLLDDQELANKIYQELANSYKLLGNPTKANMYLSKLKNGS